MQKKISNNGKHYAQAILGIILSDLFYNYACVDPAREERRNGWQLFLGEKQHFVCLDQATSRKPCDWGPTCSLMISIDLHCGPPNLARNLSSNVRFIPRD